MTEGVRGRNASIGDRIEAWEWRAPQPLPNSGAAIANEPQPEDDVREFDLEQHWMRGGYRGSLFAANDQASADFLDDLIRGNLFPLADTLRGGQTNFLKQLAFYNGSELESLRRKLQWRQYEFNMVIEQLCDRDLIFRLPFLPEDGRPDLYYLCDTGVLHRLFDRRWKLAGKGREKFAKSWEGFVIRSVWRRFGSDAAAHVWRSEERNEIDLILSWPNQRRRWAVEIGMGANKLPSKGFWIGVEELEVTDQIVVHRGECDWLDSCKRVTLQQLFISR